MMGVSVVGIGHSKFGIRNDVMLRELAFEAAKGAFEDSGLRPKDIEFVTIANFASGLWSEDLLPAPTIAEYLELNPQGTMRCEAACASGSAAIHTGYTMITSGLADVVMVIGAEKMTQVKTLEAVEVLGRAGETLWEFYPFGTTFPAYYALISTSHMKQFGTTEEHLAMVAVKNHMYGAMNPYAHFQTEIKIEDVLKSRVIAWPLKLFDCSPISDGAAAVILASEDRARKITDTPVWIAGLSSASDSHYIANRPTLVGLGSVVEASRKAYRMAGVEPKDIDVAEAHDCFTIAEIVAYEDLGFCKKGEGGKLLEEGQTYVGGKIPVNVDGGLKAKGHPIGATGVSQAVEIVKQLRGEAGKRQVPGAGVGLQHNVGASGEHCYITVYKRE